MMFRETRIQKILLVLKKVYPSPQIALHFRNPFELLVATILSAQCTDEVVNRVTPELFKHFAAPDQLAKAKQLQVEQLIRSTGFYRNKAKNLIAMAQELVKRFKGEVPKSMTSLLTLPGVARKTANVVLGSAYGIVEGIVVDTHVKRLSNRLGLTQESLSGSFFMAVRFALQKNLPVENVRLVLYVLQPGLLYNPCCQQNRINMLSSTNPTTPCKCVQIGSYN